MSLFKRVLMSLFPDDMITHNINPASMFVPFISAKNFFSVVNRRLGENYKLNLFDISLDPFEVKHGFGEQPTIKIKDIDFYYSYCVAANMNGYRFLTPSTITQSVSLLGSLYLKDTFKKYDHVYFLHFLYTIYLLGFIFTARLKVFPYDNDQENFKRMVEVIFNFYEMIFEQTGKKYDKKIIAQIKSGTLSELNFFFFLFHYYKKLNSIFLPKYISEREFYNRLFYDELRKGEIKQIGGDFIEHYKKYSQATTFGTTERILMNLIFPADISMRDLFEGKEVFAIVEHLVGEIFSQSKIDEYISSFSKNDNKLEEFILYLTDHNLYKKNYFKGIKKLMTHLYKNQTTGSLSDEIDEFLSAIGENEQLDYAKVPERIKEESKLMERLMDFYVRFIGGFRIGRGDNFFARMFRGDLFSIIDASNDILNVKQDALYYYGGLLYNYSKNVFYYKYAYENVKAGKETVNVPFRSTLREVYSNMFILKLFDENFLTILLEDINPKDIKLFLKHKEILDEFKKIYGKQISHFVHLNKEDFIDEVYGNITRLFKENNNFTETIKKTLTIKDISHLKENLYNIDFWIRKKFLETIHNQKIGLQNKYSDCSIMGILSTFKETLLGFLLYLCYIETLKNNKKFNLHISAIIRVYILDVVNISEEYLGSFEIMLYNIFNEYKHFLAQRIEIDDNKHYLQIGTENRIAFIEEKSFDEIMSNIVGEDIIWFRGYLKNISYYNKRYLIPKND